MKPSASSLDRAAACAASHALPRVYEPPGEPAQKGIGVHAFLAKVCASPADRSAALAACPVGIRATCEGIDLPELLDGLSDIRTEVAIAYDVETGTSRLVGYNIGRAYGRLGSSELACTLDLLARRGDKWVFRDWKTGQDVGEVESNWQMRLAALCVMGLHGEAPEGQIVYIGDDGRHRPSRPYEFDELDLDVAREELKGVLVRTQIAARVVKEGGTPDVSVGEHCKYCPSSLYCPAKTAIVRDMRQLIDEMSDVKDAVATMPIEKLGAVWLRAGEFAKKLEVMREAIKERAENEPVPLPGGNELVAKMREGRRTLREKDAVSLMKRLGAGDDEIGALYQLGRPYLYPQTRKAG